MYEDFLRKIENKEAKVAVIGLGYVGLPLALEISKVGFNVFGIDIDKSRIENLKNNSKEITFFTDFSPVQESDIIIICVPTPLNKLREPDISYIVSATKSISKFLKVNSLVILESTTYPGTTEEVVKSILEEKGLTCGKNFFLCFSPERIDPGNKVWKINNTPKVVGGVTDFCTNLGRKFYSTFIKEVIPVSNTVTAEMAKLLENTFRAVNIALVNEIAIVCKKIGVDVWEVIKAAKTKPFGFMAFYPGPGLGGHCIPIDPQYLSWKLKSFYSHNVKFVDLADEVNSFMPEYTVSRIIEILNTVGKSLSESSILVIGASYKKDVGDIRESPALTIIKKLIENYSTVSYYDPYVPRLRLSNNLTLLSLDNITEEDLKNADCTVILTNHTDIDYKFIVENSKMVFDTRNVVESFGLDNIIKL